ncbi:serine/threonine-protein kinase [Actinomadura fulvescens]|uniref:serine/threonine-protein kinase n=1 Tax=Actinomadura fulvescens TaxID=46160 RepID=UPI0031CF13E3
MTSRWRVSGFTEVGELGAGAFGRVVLARRDETGHVVAIKYLHGGDAAGLARLRDEAVSLGRVSSPYVVRLYRFIIGPEGQAALVMEAVDGVSLARVLDEHHRLSPEACLVVLKGSLLGLHAAHQVGVVHRDYKPANILVRPDGLSKLADFGVAASIGHSGTAGTPRYMAPEQWQSQPIGPAADVYAATCVFFQCTTGRTPFTGESTAALMRAHLHDSPPVDGVPEPLRPLVVSGLAKRPEQRPSSAAEFVTVLEEAALAAYGPDWERRGVHALAGAAAALAALLPLAAAGLGGGSAAAVGLGVGAQSSGGVLAAIGGTKVIAGVAAGVVVATGGGVGAYQALKPEPERRPAAAPRTRPVNVTVALASAPVRDTTTGLTVPNASVPTISGLADTALQARINTELRRPMDDFLTFQRSQYQGLPSASRRFQRQENQSREGRFRTRIGLRGPRYVSVAYEMDRPYAAGSGFHRRHTTTTVDLTTGKALNAADLFPPALLSATGRTRFDQVPVPAELRTYEAHCRPYSKVLYVSADANRRDVQAVVGRTLLTRAGAEFVFGADDEEVPSDCQGFAWTKLPWNRLTTLFRPDVIKAAQRSN